MGDSHYCEDLRGIIGSSKRENGILELWSKYVIIKV